MKISVIIPAYNEEKYLPACLESLRLQTKRAEEIIVVDNGSTDQTAAIARRYGANIVYQPKRGIIPARQLGFSNARGEIVARTDADSLAPPQWLDEIEQSFKKLPQACAVTGPIAYSDAPAVLLPIFNLVVHFYPYLMRQILHHPVLVGANYALRRQYFSQIKPHLDDRLVHEDIDLSCHLAKIGQIVFNPKLTMRFSARRIIYKPQSFFGEYLLRLIKTLYLHHCFLIGPHRNNF